MCRLRLRQGSLTREIPNDLDLSFTIWSAIGMKYLVDPESRLIETVWVPP